MFTPGLAIFYLATILRFSHVWRKGRFLEDSICRWQHAGAWVLERRHSSPSHITIATAGQHGQSRQVLAQGVPPGVPRSLPSLSTSRLPNPQRSSLAKSASQISTPFVPSCAAARPLEDSEYSITPAQRKPCLQTKIPSLLVSPYRGHELHWAWAWACMMLEFFSHWPMIS